MAWPLHGMVPSGLQIVHLQGPRGRLDVWQPLLCLKGDRVASQVTQSPLLFLMGDDIH